MNRSDRQIVFFTAGSHGLVHTYELAIPILMTVWLIEFSVTAALLGAAVTVGYGLFGVGALPGGILVDRYGSKPLILASLLGMAAAFLLASLAPSFVTLVIAIGIWGIAASVYHPAGLALISTSIEKPGVAYGYHGMGGNIGIALGPLATAVLLTQFDWRIVAGVLTIPTAIIVVYGLLIDIDDQTVASKTEGNTTNSDTSSTKGKLTVAAIQRDTRTLFTLGFSIIFVIVLLSGLYYRAFLTFLPDLLGDLLGGLVDISLFGEGSVVAEEFDIGHYLYVGILLFGIGGQYLGGYLAQRFAPERALGYVLAVLAGLALLFVPAVAIGVVPFVGVALLLGIALFTIQPLQQATVAAYSPEETRGLSFGYTFLAIFGIGALGAAIAGTVLTVASIDALFVVLAAIAVTGALVVTIFRRNIVSSGR